MGRDARMGDSLRLAPHGLLPPSGRRHEVDAKTGKPMPVPDTLPSTASSNPLPALPLMASYLGTVTGLPEAWTSLPIGTASS